MNTFDPRLAKRMTYEEFSEMPKEKLADSIVHHEIKVKGVPFLVWSKYDDQGELIQRAMIRASVVDTNRDDDPMRQPIKDL